MHEFDNIDIHIQRSPHVTATDFDFLDPMVRDDRFHLYAPELDGSDNAVLAGFRKISNGDSKVYQDVMSRTDRNSSWSKTFSAVFMTKKPIESFDVTADQHQANDVFRNFGAMVIDLSSVTSNQFIDNMPAQLNRLPTFIKARDTIIAQNILERLPKVIESNPKLAHLSRVGVLMSIGDNHRLLDKLLEKHGFTITRNDIPITGAHEKAGLMQIEGIIPSEADILEAAAYNLVRNFVTHDSTYELRKQLNIFSKGSSENDVSVILSLVQKYGIDGVKYVVTEKLKESDITTDLSFSSPGSKPQPVRLKETYERRNGVLGIRTSMF